MDKIAVYKMKRRSSEVPTSTVLAIRTESMDGNTCGGTLTEDCRIATQVPGVITSGDIMYDAITDTVFDGGGLYYRVKLDEWDAGDGTRVCEISSLGVINIFSICI